MIKRGRRKRPARGNPRWPFPPHSQPLRWSAVALSQTRHQLEGRVLSGGVLLDVRADLVGPRFLITFGVLGSPSGARRRRSGISRRRASRGSCRPFPHIDSQSAR